IPSVTTLRQMLTIQIWKYSPALPVKCSGTAAAGCGAALVCSMTVPPEDNLITIHLTMIELYTWPTPNGHKVHIMLVETGTPYNVHAIDIGAGDQFKPEFLKISPNNKMPAMVDTDGPGGKPFALAES